MTREEFVKKEGSEKRTDLRLQFERESESFWSVSAIPTIGYVRWLEDKLIVKQPLPPAEGAEAKAGEWKLIGHSHQIADTGDYDGYWEITNGKVSIYTQDDDDEALQPIVDALNDSGCKFYLDDANAVENYILRHDIAELKERLAQIEQQPTAEGAEEIGVYDIANKWAVWAKGNEIAARDSMVTDLYGLLNAHAQRIAEKMVSERLRGKYVFTYEELRKVCCDFFRSWWNTPGSNTDQGFDAWALKTGLKK